MLTAVVGINWGDEGKGRMVDLLSQDYKIVSRYQGGNNAGHTVVNDKGKFILNLLPALTETLEDGTKVYNMACNYDLVGNITSLFQPCLLYTSRCV